MARARDIIFEPVGEIFNWSASSPAYSWFSWYNDDHYRINNFERNLQWSNARCLAIYNPTGGGNAVYPKGMALLQGASGVVCTSLDFGGLFMKDCKYTSTMNCYTNCRSAIDSSVAQRARVSDQSFAFGKCSR